MIGLYVLLGISILCNAILGIGMLMMLDGHLARSKSSSRATESLVRGCDGSAK